MQRTTLASAECYLHWQSADATHTDRQYFPKLDLWRDIFPADMGERLKESAPGVEAVVELKAGEAIPAPEKGAQLAVSNRVLTEAFHAHQLPGPFSGRFYPRGLLTGIRGIDDTYMQDLRAFRITDIIEDQISVNLNHPLAGFPVTLGGKVSEFLKSKEERGGHCNDIVTNIAELGPGMQCRPEYGTVNFIHEHTFRRADTSEDAVFYSKPRMVHHIDKQSRILINQIYRRFIKPGARVLDLMSSWDSHLDGIPESATVHGLGMNAEELASNTRLSATRVQDLNQEPGLPYPDNSYDVALCTVSVEYLIRPAEIFAEVARVLNPGGYFLVTFSDRWFPPKVIGIWTELHPFERMGLVLEYFRQSGQFEELTTESFRGWPRPIDDKYYRIRPVSDPVFAVWGQHL